MTEGINKAEVNSAREHLSNVWLILDKLSLLMGDIFFESHDSQWRESEVGKAYFAKLEAVNNAQQMTEEALDLLEELIEE